MCYYFAILTYILEPDESRAKRRNPSGFQILNELVPERRGI